MYQKTTFAVIVALCFLGAQASNAVEDGPSFTTGDTWAFGKEINLMEEISSDIAEIENNITRELIESDNATMVENYTGLKLTSFELGNQAVLGFYYTGEIIDDFDQMIHMQTEQSLYSHTVFGTKFTSMLPPAGQHELVLYIKCSNDNGDEENDEEENDDEGCSDEEIQLLDNATGEPMVMQAVNTELIGSMHYVAKITEETWWTEDTHDLVKTKITLALGASGDITIKNVPNLTFEGVPLTEALDSDPMFECEDGDEIEFHAVNDGWEDCWDGGDEPSDDDGDGSIDQRFECNNGDTYSLDYVNDGMWDCEDGEDEGENPDALFSKDCDETYQKSKNDEEESSVRCYEKVDIAYETAVFSMKTDASMSIMFDFGDKPMNVMDLPLDENKYWEGELEKLTISGDIGGKVEVDKPQLSICPNLDCDNLPEMKELYSDITEALQELYDNEDIMVDRDNDDLPDVITEWNDIFPVYIPETWMDDVLQQAVDDAFCDDEESAQEGEECDETAEEEYKKLNIRIENNRFAFGPYNLHDIEDFEPLPYAFETHEKEDAKGSDGNTYEGYQVFPTDSCSENNPKRDDEDCDRDDEDDEDDDRDDDDGGIIPGSRSSHEPCNPDVEDCEDHCEGPFCDSDIIWFHDANTGRPAYINMEMPNAREEGYAIEMTPIPYSEAQEKVEQNADPANPSKTELIDSSKILDDSDELSGFGIMAAGASLLFVSRRFRS